MAWKDEIQAEADKVANAKWASTLRDAMNTSLTKLANFYETIMVELTPQVEAKAEAKTLEVLGGANTESVAAEVVLARDAFPTLDQRLDANDVQVTQNKNAIEVLNSAKRVTLFEGSASFETSKTIVSTTNNKTSDFDAFEIHYANYVGTTSSWRYMSPLVIPTNVRHNGALAVFVNLERTVVGSSWVQIGSNPNDPFNIWCASVSYTDTTAAWLANYKIRKVIGIKY